jgi:hypothetical protein
LPLESRSPDLTSLLDNPIDVPNDSEMVYLPKNHPAKYAILACHLLAKLDRQLVRHDSFHAKDRHTIL